MVLKQNNFSSLSHSDLGIEESRMRNDRQTVFEVTRDLVQAQFHNADQDLTKRLWQDLCDRNIDLNRVIHLMYRLALHDDDLEMTKIDEQYQTID